MCWSTNVWLPASSIRSRPWLMVSHFQHMSEDMRSDRDISRYLKKSVQKDQSGQSEQQIFESMYLGDHWELWVHIETADACAPVAFKNNVSGKFKGEL